jgi:hypothetical protein
MLSIKFCIQLLFLSGTVAIPASSTRTTAQESGPSKLPYANTRFANVSQNNDNWQLAITTLDQGYYQSRMSIANGYIGINVAALGPFEVDTPIDDNIINDWPLCQRRQTFAMIAGFFDQISTGSSYISSVP